MEGKTMDETYNLLVKPDGRPHRVYEFDANSWNAAFIKTAEIQPRAKWTSVGQELAVGQGLLGGEEVDLTLFKKYSDVAAEFDEVIHTFRGDRL